MTCDIATLKQALEDEETAFLQVEFALRLLIYCGRGKIHLEEFQESHTHDFLKQTNLRLVSLGEFDDSDKIIKAADTSMILALAGSALALDQACEAAGITSCPESKCQKSELRTLVYMIRCAFAHSIIAPKWEVRGKYKRKITVKVALFTPQTTIDLSKLDGQLFDFSQIGGYRVWYYIRHYLVSELRGIANK